MLILECDYFKTVLQAIQNSQGGVAQNVATAIEQMVTEANGVLAIDGYSWTIEESDVKTTSNKGLEPLAARQLALHLSDKDREQLTLPELDAIHQIANNHSIVTPYSSMIVLVNDRQREQLKAAEAKSDRFNREVETGVEQLDTLFNPFETTQVSGVPEPDLWILLGIVTLALILVFQRQQFVENIEPHK